MPATYTVATMLRADMSEARALWLDAFKEPQERIEGMLATFSSRLTLKESIWTSIRFATRRPVG